MSSEPDTSDTPEADEKWFRAARKRIPRGWGEVDYRYHVTMPIRDMQRNGRVYCLVDIYGVTTKDIAVIPGGSAPLRHAVERLGLDPERYQAVIWDTPI